MAIIPWQRARELLVVNPDTGLQIPHVAACDPQAGWLEVYVVTPTYPAEGMEMIVVEKDAVGKQVTTQRKYTFIETTNPDTGDREYMRTRVSCRFDVIHKYSGEVIHEVSRGGPVPARFADPEKYALDFGLDKILR